MIKVEFHNVDKIEKFLRELPKKIDKQLTVTNTLFIDMVATGARDRAPVDTGSLRDSIHVLPIRKGKNVKKWKIQVGSPYGLFQEEGFTPHSFFAGGAFNSSKLAPGVTYNVSKWTPFLEPALNEQLSTFDNKLNSAVGRAIK